MAGEDDSLQLFDAFTNSTAKISLQGSPQEQVAKIQRLLADHNKMCEVGLQEIRSYAVDLFTLTALRCPKAKTDKDCVSPCEWYPGLGGTPMCISQWDPRLDSSRAELRRLQREPAHRRSQQESVALAVLENLHSVSGGIGEVLAGISGRIHKLPRVVMETMKVREEFDRRNPRTLSQRRDTGYDNERAVTYSSEQVMLNDVAAVEKTKARLEELWGAATPKMQQLVMRPEFADHDLARARDVINLAGDALRFFRSKKAEYKWEPLSKIDFGKQGLVAAEALKNAKNSLMKRLPWNRTRDILDIQDAPEDPVPVRREYPWHKENTEAIDVDAWAGSYRSPWATRAPRRVLYPRAKYLPKRRRTPSIPAARRVKRRR